jgi:hypothetical protein
MSELLTKKQVKIMSELLTKKQAKIERKLNAKELRQCDLKQIFNPFRRSMFPAEITDKTRTLRIKTAINQDFTRLHLIAVDDYFCSETESEGRQPEIVIRAVYGTDFCLNSIIYQDVNGAKHTAILRNTLDIKTHTRETPSAYWIEFC